MTKPTRAEQEKILAMPSEDYMNPAQQDYFRRLIRHERQEVLDHIDQMKQQLQEDPETGDEGDIAIREEQLRLLFRQIDRESRLLPKYDAALIRLKMENMALPGYRRTYRSATPATQAHRRIKY
ncbi:hypothetical protein RKJ96_09720 [Klebsiella pneumoniae]|nr:hypothetical protein [Klebsiella pneumoniae]